MAKSPEELVQGCSRAHNSIPLHTLVSLPPSCPKCCPRLQPSSSAAATAPTGDEESDPEDRVRPLSTMSEVNSDCFVLRAINVEILKSTRPLPIRLLGAPFEGFIIQGLGLHRHDKTSSNLSLPPNVLVMTFNNQSSTSAVWSACAAQLSQVESRLKVVESRASKFSSG